MGYPILKKKYGLIERNFNECKVIGKK